MPKNKLFGNYSDLITKAEYYQNCKKHIYGKSTEFDFESFLAGDVILVLNAKTMKSYLIQFTGDIDEGNLYYARYVGPAWRIRDKIRTFTKTELFNFFFSIRTFPPETFDYKVVDNAHAPKLIRIRKLHIRKRYWDKAKEQREQFQKLLKTPDPDLRDHKRK